jgi:flagellar assembly factor FliW
VNINTTRFGPIQARPDDLILVPDGLVGFRDYHQFVLWSDPEVKPLSWLQSVTEPSLAFALVAPALAVADYHVELRPGDRIALELTETEEPTVMVILNRGEQGLTVNLQGPLIINSARRLARQLVLTSSRYAVRYPLDHAMASPTLLPKPVTLRATA